MTLSKKSGFSQLPNVVGNNNIIINNNINNNNSIFGGHSSISTSFHNRRPLGEFIWTMILLLVFFYVCEEWKFYSSPS
jgi:hypothetical protein